MQFYVPHRQDTKAITSPARFCEPHVRARAARLSLPGTTSLATHARLVYFDSREPNRTGERRKKIPFTMSKHLGIGLLSVSAQFLHLRRWPKDIPSNGVVPVMYAGVNFDKEELLEVRRGTIRYHPFSGSRKRNLVP